MEKNRKRLLIGCFIALVLFTPFAFFATGCKGKVHQSGQHGGKALYQCAMHPQIVSDKPENCPICGMRLMRVDQPSSATAKKASKGKGKILYYQHPMRPDITSPTPAKDEMGMDYIPIHEGESSESGAITIPGHGEVNISPERQQLIGVKTTTAQRILLNVTIRAVGRVAYDPELYNFLSEYKQAVAAEERIKESPLPQVRERAEALIRSSELKLRQLGLTEDQMKELLKADQANSNLLLPSDKAWVYGEIYEYEMKLVKPGQKAQITTPALPGMTFEGKIIAIDPILNAMSRTLKVRIEVINQDKALTPEMFVDVVIEAPLGEKLAIPEDALFDMGDKQFVFVDQGEGRLVPTEIKVGHEADGYYEILEGLTEGEKVVNSANFLIDSESRFRAAAKGFGGAKKQEQNQPVPAEKETSQPKASDQH